MRKCPSCGFEPPAQTSENVGELLDIVVDEDLNEWERGFIAQIRERWEKYYDNIRMSDKQMVTLRKIASK